MNCNVIRRWMAGMILWTVAAGMAAANVIDFEDLVLGPNSHWAGPDPAGVDKPDPYGGPMPVKVGSFTSGGAMFGNEYNLNYDSWGGFGYSNRTDNTTPGFGNQFSAFTGTGNGPGNDNYGIVFGYVNNFDPQDPTHVAELPYIAFAEPVNPQSVHVTNMTYPALTMRDGDMFSKQFGGETGSDPDWFKLSIYGSDVHGNVLPDVVEFYLADYRFDDDSLDYIVDTWELVDLSPLAGVLRLHFNLTSSDSGPHGINTPGLFAIDDLAFAHVPEPSSLLLAVLGGLAFAAARRRRK